MDRLSRRSITSRARPLPLARHCIGLALAGALMFAGGATLHGQSNAPTTAELGRINAARRGHQSERVGPSPALDRLATRYLEDLLARRALTPAGYGEVGDRVLSDDVAMALGEDGFNYRYVGVVVAYGQSLNHALDVAVGTVANGPALFEPALTEAGLAAAVIPAGDAWFAPPPGGFGRDIEMTGMTLVVIVTAGPFRAGL